MAPDMHRKRLVEGKLGETAIVTLCLSWLSAAASSFALSVIPRGLASLDAVVLIRACVVEPSAPHIETVSESKI